MTLVSEILLQARQRADMVGSRFIKSDAELGFFNQAYKALYSLITNSNEDYFVSSTTYTTSEGVSDYALPIDFGKLLGVDLYGGGQVLTLKPFSFNERNRYQENTAIWFSGEVELRYALAGTNLRISPKPSAGKQLTLWYAPKAPTVTDVSTDVQTHNFDEYLVLYVAMKMLSVEESDTSLIAQELVKREQEIVRSFQRDSAFPDKIQDVDRLNSDYFHWV